MDEHRRFGPRKEEDEERFGRYEEGFESGGAGRYAQFSESGRGFRDQNPRGGGQYGQGRSGQGSYRQESYGRGSRDQGAFGQGGRESRDEHERGYEGRSFDRSLGEDAWRSGEPSRFDSGSSYGPSWRDRSGQQEWSESEGYRGEPRMRQFEGTRGGFSGGSRAHSMGRGGQGEGADFGQQRYSGSYGLGYGGQRGESYGSMMGRFFGKGPKGYTRSDERIKEQVSDKLEEHGEIDASEITVDVKQGEITLEGTVPDRWMKRLAEDVAEECPGVKQVHNRIRVEKENGSTLGSTPSKERDASLGSSSGSTSGSEKSSRGRRGL